jgi:cobalamin biosynthesis protein CobD/CbiB
LSPTTHFPLSLTLLPAMALAGALGGYWWRLGLADVDPRRRRIRRLSTVFMGFAVCFVLTGVSVIDPSASTFAYVTCWLVACLLLLLVMGCAALDALDSLRRHAGDWERETGDEARRLLNEIRRREGDEKDTDEQA